MAERKQLDTRGHDCPEPVVMARRAMLELGSGGLEILIDNEASLENIGRLAETEGWQATVARQADCWRMTLVRGESPQPAAAAQSPPSRSVVLIASEFLGSGDDQLGRILMRAFIKTLGDLDPPPAKAMFLNAGVRWTTAGSDLLDDLRRLHQRGVEVLSCGTCLDYFKLLDKLEVGRVTNMFEIVASLAAADRVLRP